MELSTFLIAGAGLVIVALADYIRRLNRIIRRNDRTIADLRVAKINYRDKAEYFSNELKKAKAYIAELEADEMRYKMSSVGGKIRAMLERAAEDKEVFKVQILASETDAAVIAEAAFARAANH